MDWVTMWDDKIFREKPSKRKIIVSESKTGCADEKKREFHKLTFVTERYEGTQKTYWQIYQLHRNYV